MPPRRRSRLPVASVTGNVDLATIVKGGSGYTTGAASGVATGSAGDASGISSTSAAAAVTNDAGGNNSSSAVDVAATTAVEATTAEGCAVVTTAITPVAPSKQAACSTIVKTVAADATSAVLATLTSATVGQVTSAGVNIQSFTGILGGPPPPVVSSAGDRPFSVNGNTFTDAGAALSRSCDTQHNAYANAANSRQLAGGTAQCETQSSGCRATNTLKKRQNGSFGSCSDLSIIFAAGLNGRKQEAFAPSNEADFNHGSAQKIGIIADFICQRLGDSCRPMRM
ncbi:hypothetical protein NW759_017191 [Fusarium solani]|nr:hypothetical protein NW759_017191 [Fusarium solani]